jgi:hypothetical protein
LVVISGLRYWLRVAGYWLRVTRYWVLVEA